MAVKAQKVRISSYIRNVGRSFGYAVGDVAGSYAPTLKSIVDDSKSAIEDAKMSSSDLKSSIKNMINEYKTGVVANTLDDLKTGNWYNKKREEQAMNDMFGGDFDFGDDWGDWDDSDDDSDFSDSSDDTRDTKAIINSIDSVGENISKNVAYSNARSAEYIVANQKASTRAMYELTGKGFNQVSGILMNMSNTMVGLASLGEPLSQHIQNSGVFYTKTTESLEKINSSLDKLVERTAYMDEMNKKQSGNRKKSIHDVVSGGEFSLSSYIDLVKENTKEQLEMVSGFKDMFEMMGGKGGKNASLAKLIPETMIKSVMPKFFKTTLEQFNETINNALVNGLMRGSRAAAKSDNPIINLLGSFLFPEFKMKKGIDSSKYDRGPMQWDGEAKKALTRVIPDYLAKIYEALTGSPAQHFNYKTGKYETLKQINDNRTKFINDQGRSASRDLKREMTRGMSAAEAEEIENQMDAFIAKALMSSDFSMEDLFKLEKSDPDAFERFRDKFGISDKLYKAIKEINKKSNSGRFNKNRNLMGSFERQFYDAQLRISNEFQAQELQNGSWGMLNNGNFLNGGYVVGLGGGNRKGKGGSRTINPIMIDDYLGTKVSYKPSKVQGKESTYQIGNFEFQLTDKELRDMEKKLAEFDSDEEKNRFLQKTKAGRELKGASEKLTNAFKNNKDVEEQGGIKKLLSMFKHTWERPFYSVTLALDTLSKGFNDVFYGENGILARLKESWGNLKDKIKEFFPDDATKKKETMKQSMGKELKNLGRKAVGAIMGEDFLKATDKYKYLRERRDKFNQDYLDSEAERDEFGESGMGSGLIHKLPSHSLSSGFKRTKKFKSTMYSGGASKDNRKKLFGVGANRVQYFVDKAGKYFTRDLAGEWTEIKDKEDIDAIEGIQNQKLSEARGQMIDAAKNSKPAQTIAEGGKILYGGLTKFFNQVAYGDKANSEDVEKQKKNVFDSLSKTMKDLPGAKGVIGIGAIGGVGVSLLTGALVGPIAGAALGAGIGLATKSQAFQDFLFGKGDPDDPEYKKGLLGEFGKALKADGFQSAKKVGIGAGAGAAAGMVMGSPIVGAILGGAAGYVASSEKAQKMLFGEGDEKTMLGKAKDEIKKRFPNMTAGMIAGLVAGPFTLPGNLILGASLGYVSTSDKFKNFMFGDPNDKNDKGLAGKIHDRIMNPLNEIMHNLANITKNWAKRLFTSLGRTLKNWGKGLLGVLGNTKIGQRVKGVGNLAMGAISGAVDIAGNVLGAPNKKLQQIALNSGADIYDAELGRNRTFAERNQLRNLIKNGYVQEVTDEEGNIIGYEKINKFSGKRKSITKDRYEKIKQRASERKGWKEDSKAGSFEQIMAQMSQEGRLKDLDLNDMDSVRSSIAQFASEKDFDENLTANALKFTKNEISTKDLILGEMKLQEKISKENEEKQDKSLDASIKTVDYLQQIRDFIIFGKTPKVADAPKAEGGKIVKRTGKDGVDRYYREDENGKLGKQMKTAEGALAYQQQEEMNVSTPTGDVITYKKGQDGRLQPDIENKETKNALDKMDKFNNAIFQIPVIGGALKGIHSGLSRFGKFLFGDKDDDGSKGLLGGIFSAVGGAASGLIKLITGKDVDFSVLGKGIKSGLSKLVTKDGLLFAAENFLGPALLAFAFSGKFDKIASKLSGDAYNEKSSMQDANISVTTEDGQVINGVHKEGKNFVDSEGNIINNVSSVNNMEKGRASFSDRLKYNTGRGLATGKSSVTTKVLKKTAIGKALTKNGAGIADDVAQKALRTNVITTLRDVCAKLAKLPMLKNLNIDFDGLANTLSKKISQAMSSGAAKTVAKVAAGAVAVFRIAFIAVDFSTGYQDARSTFGITDEPTTGQRIVSGLIRVIKNCIPIVGTLVPDELLVDIFCDYVAPALGIDVNELKEQRQKAQEEVDAYNAEHGTDYSVSDYNKKVLGDYTWTEKIGNKASEMWENFKLGSSKIGEGISGAIDKVKNSTNLFKEALDSGIQKIYDGDIKGYWDVSELDDPENPMSGFNTAIAKVGRFAAFPVVAFKWVGFKIKETISKAVDAVKDDFSSLKDSMGNQIEAASTADVKTLLQNATWTPPNLLNDPLGGVFMGIHGITYPFTITIGAFKGIGAKIKEAIGPIVDEFKTEASGFSAAMNSMNEAAKNKDLKGIWSSGYTKSTNGIAGSIFSGLHFVMKFVKTIGLAINTIAEPFKSIGNAVGNAVGDKVGGLIENGKEFLGKIGSGVFNVFHGMADEAALGAGSSGFVSQFDPRYQNLKVSGSSFAGKGCGPAVASMVASSLGKNLPVSSAVSASQGYQVGNGVTLDYFQRALGSQGIDTEYIAGSGAGDLYNSIASGKKVVLLGQDASNTSKDYSPFGPNNHYVVATGLDHSGNVVINDPELNGPAVYSPGILNSVKYGVAAGRSGLRRSGSRRFRRLAGGASADIAQQVWAFFISKGFSEIATASIMGNLQAESGMNPAAVQKGSGRAAGIAQWEDYKNKEGRWKNLNDFARKLGVDWTNLDAQLNFLLSELLTKDMDQRMQGAIAISNFAKAGLDKSQGMTFEYFKTQNRDIDRGTRVFEAAFERASVQAMDKRINAAKEFYNRFSGKEYVYDSTISNSAAQEALASIESSSTESNEKPSSIFGLIGSISSLFSDAFSGIFNKNEESSSNENTDSTGENVNDVVSNTASGPRIGEKIAEFPGGKARPHPQGRNNAASVVEIARSQLGVTEAPENITDYGKFTGTDGKAWCAAFASWVYDKAFNGNKDARNKALRGGTSASVSTFLNNFKRANAITQTPQPGDLAIYKNGTSHVGIVEAVDGNTVYTIEGNTSPDKSFSRDGGSVYRKSFNYTNRTSGKGAKLTGFGRPDWSYSAMANNAGGSSGVLMRSRAGSAGTKPAFVDPTTGRIIPFSRFAGGATNIADASRNMLNQIATSAASNNNSSKGISTELVTQLLSAITGILEKIADNTTPINRIYQALAAYLEAGGASGIDNNKGNQIININRAPQKAAAGGGDEIDPNIKSLVATLAELAKG